MSAAMSRNRRAKAARIPAVVLDVGPLTKFQMDSGRYEDTAHGDPDRPMFQDDGRGGRVQVGFHERKGLRRAVHYASMSLTATQREACDRLCVKAERAGGAAWRPDGPVVALHPSQRGHPAEWQVAAASDLRRARAALGTAAWGVLWRLVVENVPMIQDAPTGHARALLTGRVLAGLDRLVEHWGME